MQCPIDNQLMHFAFAAQILGKYPADYFRCSKCSLIQPSNPHWLAESYESAIAATDVGLVLRNKGNLEALEPILHRLHPTKGKILDVGGGYGLLCRGLRDAGFDCYTSDLYCENLFAKEFEPKPDFHAETLLAFEVFEHISNPLEFVSDCMEKYNSKRFVFSTLTHSGSEPPPQDWWYYAFETGQHISLYHERSLQTLADTLSLDYLPISSSFHIFSKPKISLIDRLCLDQSGRFLKKFYKEWARYQLQGLSLTQYDYERAKEKLRSKYPPN
jgi:hypothetical protein